MKIVALDAYGLNPGDLSWDLLNDLGELIVYDRTPPPAVRSRAAGADALLVDHLEFSSELFDTLPDLRYIGLFSTGYDRIDLEAARRNRVAVTNVPDYSTPSVAQMTFALLLSLTNRTREYAALVRRDEWIAGRNFHYLDAPLVELSGKTIAVLGLGAIGTAVARIARAFGMHIISWNRRSKSVPGLDVEWLSLDELFRRADVVTLHLLLNDETTGIVNAHTISLMKREALLINTSRGGLVDDSALADALNSGRLAGAGLDVVGTSDPPAADNPLLSAENCVITPHIAWASQDARLRCLNEAYENLRSFLAGGSRNRVA